MEAPLLSAGPGPGRRRAAFHLASGTIVLVEADQRRAAVLGVKSLAKSRAALASVVLPTDDDGIAWLDPSANSDLAIGFAETRPIDRSRIHH